MTRINGLKRTYRAEWLLGARIAGRPRPTARSSRLAGTVSLPVGASWDAASIGAVADRRAVAL